MHIIGERTTVGKSRKRRCEDDLNNIVQPVRQSRRLLGSDDNKKLEAEFKGVVMHHPSVTVKKDENVSRNVIVEEITKAACTDEGATQRRRSLRFLRSEKKDENVSRNVNNKEDIKVVCTDEGAIQIRRSMRLLRSDDNKKLERELKEVVVHHPSVTAKKYESLRRNVSVEETTKAVCKNKSNAHSNRRSYGTNEDSPLSENSYSAHSICSILPSSLLSSSQKLLAQKFQYAADRRQVLRYIGYPSEDGLNTDDKEFLEFIDEENRAKERRARLRVMENSRRESIKESTNGFGRFHGCFISDDCSDSDSSILRHLNEDNDNNRGRSSNCHEKEKEKEKECYSDSEVEDEDEDEEVDEEHSTGHSPNSDDDISEKIKKAFEENLNSKNQEIESNSKSASKVFSDDDSDEWSDDSDELDRNDNTLGFTLKKSFKLIPEKENLEPTSEEKICRKAAYPNTGFRCSRQTGVYNDLEVDMGLQLWDRW